MTTISVAIWIVRRVGLAKCRCVHDESDPKQNDPSEQHILKIRPSATFAKSNVSGHDNHCGLNSLARTSIPLYMWTQQDRSQTPSPRFGNPVSRATFRLDLRLFSRHERCLPRKIPSFHVGLCNTFCMRPRMAFSGFCKPYGFTHPWTH